jgi:hypothetical protein
MSSPQEATVNPDGSTTYEDTTTAGSAGGSGPEDATNGGNGFEDAGGAEETFEELVVKGIDPAFYLIGATILVVILYYFFVMRKKSDDDEDDFFSNMDCEKVRVVTRYFSKRDAAPFIFRSCLICHSYIVLLSFLFFFLTFSYSKV